MAQRIGSELRRIEKVKGSHGLQKPHPDCISIAASTYKRNDYAPLFEIEVRRRAYALGSNCALPESPVVPDYQIARHFLPRQSL